MIETAEIEAMAERAAKKLGVRRPSVSFVPARISFLPVLVMNGKVTVTPAARQGLTPGALEFAVIYGLANEHAGNRLRPFRFAFTFLVPVLVAFLLRFSFPKVDAGPAFMLFLIAFVGGFLLSILLLNPWQESMAAKETVAHLNDLAGAREYVATVERYDLTGDVPVDAPGKRGSLFKLERLEALWAKSRR